MDFYNDKRNGRPSIFDIAKAYEDEDKDDYEYYHEDEYYYKPYYNKDYGPYKSYKKLADDGKLKILK